MKINLRRSIPLLGVTVAGAALAVGAATGGAGSPVAARDQAPPVEHVAVARTATDAATQHNTGSTAPKIELVSAAAARYTATVKVTDALLRSQPNTRSTKLDVSQPPRGVDIYCWHDYTDVSHYVWFKAHPWGSRYTGWMRADLLYRTGPLPPRC